MEQKAWYNDGMTCGSVKFTFVGVHPETKSCDAVITTMIDSNGNHYVDNVYHGKTNHTWSFRGQLSSEIEDTINYDRNIQSLLEAMMKEKSIATESSELLDDIIFALGINRTLSPISTTDSNIGVDGANKLALILQGNIKNKGQGDGHCGFFNEVDGGGIYNNGDHSDDDYHWNRLMSVYQLRTRIRCLTLFRSSLLPVTLHHLAYALTKNQIIEDVDVSDNGLEVEYVVPLVAALQTNHTITHVNLAGNLIRNEGAQIISLVLQANSTITHLNLSVNEIQSTGVALLASALMVNHSLTHLDLGNNILGVEGAKHLASSLTVNQTLTNLNLEGSNCECEGVKEIASALKVNQTIVELNLRQNSIRNEGVESLALALQTNQSIITINLSWNKISAGAKGLAEALMVNNTIADIDLRYNKIGKEGGVELAAALKENRTISSINLTGNHIGPESIYELANTLMINKNIKKLFLSFIGIDPLEVNHLVSAVKSNQSLSHLDVSYNELDTNDAEKLSSIFLANVTLVQINLGGNDLGDEGLAKLTYPFNSHAIAFASLRELDLSDNDISDKGAFTLATILERNTSLSRINLLNNQIASEGMDRIQSAVKHNDTITTVNLDGNPCYVVPTAKESFEKSLKRNKKRLVDLYFQKTVNYNNILSLNKSDLICLSSYIEKRWFTKVSPKKMEKVIQTATLEIQEKILRLILSCLVPSIQVSLIYHSKIMQYLSLQDLEKYSAFLDKVQVLVKR